MNNEILIKNIKELCKNKDIKISQLESDLKFGAGLISRWAKSDPSLSKIIDVADYFNVSLDEIVGRNMQSSNGLDDELLTSLTLLTLQEVIHWDSIDDPFDEIANGIPYEDAFSLYSGEEIEIYKATYKSSYIFLVSQYDLERGMIENLDISLYIQPDETSNPVSQKNDSNSMEEFWVEIRKPFKGVPDEWKANTIKRSILNDSLLPEILKQKDCVQNINSETEIKCIPGWLKKYNEVINSEEMQSTIKFLNSESFLQTQKLLSSDFHDRIMKYSQFLSKSLPGDEID